MPPPLVSLMHINQQTNLVGYVCEPSYDELETHPLPLSMFDSRPTPHLLRLIGISD